MNESPKQIWHIYYATRGAAGAYIDALLRASEQAGIKARAFVSANYRFQFGKLSKVFFPITDRSDKRNNIIRLLRGFELLLGYLYAVPMVLLKRPHVMIHFIDDFQVTYLMFRFLQAMNIEVSLTCHDVGSHYLGMSAKRKYMFDNAASLIVHNSAARSALINLVGGDVESRIVTYPFPFSSYNDILDETRMRHAESELNDIIGSDDGYYLFLGVVRRTKGIEDLVDAWSRANENNNHKLVLAGAWTDPDPKYRELVESNPSCVVIDRYISDEEFALLIAKARFVVLPYHEYAHSSVVLSCGNHNGAVIISDIGLFTELLPNYSLTHKSRDIADLVKTLQDSMALNQQEVATCKATLALTIKHENKKLVQALREAYLNHTSSNVNASEGSATPYSSRMRSTINPSNRLKQTISGIPEITNYRLESSAGEKVEFIWDGQTIADEDIERLTKELASQCNEGATITMRKSKIRKSAIRHSPSITLDHDKKEAPSIS